MAKNTNKMSRRKREKLTHEFEILVAAERVFVSKGFDHATIEDIAKEAEFSVGAIYNFFNGKDDLREKVITKIIEDFLEIFRGKVLCEQDAMKAIEALIDLRVRHVKDHEAFFRLILDTQLGASIKPDEALPKRCRNVYDNYINEVALIFKRAMNEGLVCEMDPVYAALAFEGCINAFTAYWNRLEIVESAEVQIAHIKQSYLRMILKNKKQASVDAPELINKTERGKL